MEEENGVWKIYCKTINSAAHTEAKYIILSAVE